MSDGILAVWNDVASEHEPEFNDWYIREHIPERVSVPGFLCARRYLSLRGSPRNFTYYETENVAVLGSSAYRGRLDHPTQWTERVMPWFVDISRSACTERLRIGDGVGGTTAVATFSAVDGREEELAGHLFDRFLPDLASSSPAVSVRLWECDPDITGIDSRERRLRSAPDRSGAWIVVADATNESEIRTVADQIASGPLSKADAATIAPVNTFGLAYTLMK